MAGAVSFSAFAENYTIGTGSQSGTYYPLGGTLAKIWGETLPDFNMRAEVTAGSVENSIKVSTNKQLAGIAMGSVVLKA
ncbi:TAXI family TRAP transporter solute-binding subunit, partial [Vibrio campbellii]